MTCRLSSGGNEHSTDTSLTSLSWLLNLRVLDIVSPDMPITISPADEACKLDLSPINKCLLQCAEFSRSPRKFRTDSMKPPFSSTTLILLAMKYSRSGRLSVKDLLRWIRLNFKHYRLAGKEWEVSVERNLTLSDMFVRVCDNDGTYWRLSPEYSKALHTTGRGRKRAHSTGDQRTLNIRKRRIHSDSSCPADPCGLPGDLDWVSLLSSQRVGCPSCPSESCSCRPSFGSPVLGTPDLGHIGEPVVCSPLVANLVNEMADLPNTSACSTNGALLEEVVLQQDSPPSALLPWESQSQSPKEIHPWAESKEKTLHVARNLSKRKGVKTFFKRSTSVRSVESSWSSSSSYSSSNSRLAPYIWS